MDTTTLCDYEFRVFGNYDRAEWPSGGYVYAFGYQRQITGEWVLHLTDQRDAEELWPDKEDWEVAFDLTDGDGDGMTPYLGLRVLIRVESDPRQREHVVKELLGQYPSTLNRFSDSS